MTLEEENHKLRAELSAARAWATWLAITNDALAATLGIRENRRNYEAFIAAHLLEKSQPAADPASESHPGA